MKSRTVQASAAALGDKPCIYCGTELHGLTAHDRCPTCGKPAVDSLLQNYLRDADHGWLRTILRGITFIAVAYGVVIVSAVLGMVAVFVRQQDFDVTVYRNVVNISAMALLALGMWFLTAAEPADTVVARRRVLPWGLRIASLLCVAVVALMMARTTLPPEAIRAVTVAGGAALFLTYVLPWIHLRRLNDRTPRREVSRLLRFTLWLTAAVLLLSIAVILGQSRLPSPTLRRYVAAARGLAWIAQHGFAIYVLVTTSKGIRRTVGYWT